MEFSEKSSFFKFNIINKNPHDPLKNPHDPFLGHDQTFLNMCKPDLHVFSLNTCTFEISIRANTCINDTI